MMPLIFSRPFLKFGNLFEQYFVVGLGQSWRLEFLK